MNKHEYNSTPQTSLYTYLKTLTHAFQRTHSLSYSFSEATLKTLGYSKILDDYNTITYERYDEPNNYTHTIKIFRNKDSQPIFQSYNSTHAIHSPKSEFTKASYLPTVGLTTQEMKLFTRIMKHKQHYWNR